MMCLAGIALILTLLLSVFLLFIKLPLSSNVLERPAYGMADQSYEFYAVNQEGTEEKVQLQVGARTYTEEEALMRCTQCFSSIKSFILGDNPSFDHVNVSLDFSLTEREGYDDVQILVYSSDSSFFDSEGILLSEEHEPGSYELTLYVELTCESYRQVYEIPVIVIIQEEIPGKKSVSSYLKDLESNTKADTSVTLPDQIEDTAYQYYQKTSVSTIVMMILLVLSLCTYPIYRQRNEIRVQCKERERQMEADYPMLVSRLMILMKAGMSIRKAWYKIVADYEKTRNQEFRYVLEEMMITRQEMEQGIGERACYLRFGKRCGLSCYMKLGSLLEQNLRKGTQGMLSLLETERLLALENRKQQIKAEGEVAGSKLMMPMMVLFALVMAIVMVPALMSFNF